MGKPPIGAFIFRLTSACDKKCPVCCNNFDDIWKPGVAAFGALLERFSDIASYWSGPGGKLRPAERCVILTGGEPLLYKSRHGNAPACLFDVLEALERIVPAAKILVKTGGFRSDDRYVPPLFDRIGRRFDHPALEWRLGWNLYQDPEREALDRLVFTVAKILMRQPVVSIETIYDRSNVAATCDLLEQALRVIGINVDAGLLSRPVLRAPENQHRMEIKVAEYCIDLHLGPAYAPSPDQAARGFYAERSSRCDTIHEGVSSVYYDVNLGLMHCNDPFVDARIPALARQGCSIAEDVAELDARFEQLRGHITDAAVMFETRKARCFFCTEFVLNSRSAVPA